MKTTVIENFRDHLALRWNDPKYVFKLDDKIYLLEHGVIRQIISRGICHTNIGEPYAKLVRLDYVFADESDEEYPYCIDFDPKYEEELLSYTN